MLLQLHCLLCFGKEAHFTLTCVPHRNEHLYTSTALSQLGLLMLFFSGLSIYAACSYTRDHVACLLSQLSFAPAAAEVMHCSCLECVLLQLLGFENPTAELGFLLLQLQAGAQRSAQQSTASSSTADFCATCWHGHGSADHQQEPERCRPAALIRNQPSAPYTATGGRHDKGKLSLVHIPHPSLLPHGYCFGIHLFNDQCCILQVQNMLLLHSERLDQMQDAES